MLRSKPPLLIAGLLAIVIFAGAAVAFAINSDDDSPEPGPTATSTPAETPTAAPASPTTTPEPSATPVAPTATVTVAEIWSIDFERTGGFAGLAQSLSVSSDGQAVYRDLRAERTESGVLSAADLVDLRALIDSSGFFSQSTPQEAPCADCFNLSITVTVDGSTHTVQAVDIGLDVTLEPLVERLVMLLEDGLAP